MTERILDSLLLFRWANQLLSVCALGLVVVLPFLDPHSILRLSNIERRHLEAVLFFNVGLNFGIGGLTLGNGHILRFQIYAYTDRIIRLLLGQKNYRLDGCRFVEVLYHPILQTIILRPSNEDNPNSFEWENDNGKPKQVISSRAFCRAIYDQMEWMNEYRFKFRGIERSRGNTKVLIFALDEPQILVNKPQPNPPEGSVEYINYKRDNTIPKHGKSEQLKGRAFVAYPAELTHGNVGLTYSLKRRLDTISHNLTEEDITSDGVTFVNPMMQKLPTRQEMLDEVDRLLESM